MISNKFCENGRLIDLAFISSKSILSLKIEDNIFVSSFVIYNKPLSVVDRAIISISNFLKSDIFEEKKESCDLI